jgi:hypothetical protein
MSSSSPTTPSDASPDPPSPTDPHLGLKRLLAAGHVVVGLVLILGWLLLSGAWAVYVLGNDCFEGPCTFSDTEKTVAVIQALIAAPGLIALGFAVAQGVRYTINTESSTYAKQSLQVAGGVFAAWVVFLLAALVF